MELDLVVLTLGRYVRLTSCMGNEQRSCVLLDRDRRSAAYLAQYERVVLCW